MSRYLLDSSFLIDLLNEAAEGRSGKAMRWLSSHPEGDFWISPVTYSEVMEGADDSDSVRIFLGRFRWQPIAHAQAERVATLQRRQAHRFGENDAWQVGVAVGMEAVIVGHDAAFGRLGRWYEDFW
jgi:predicted nucleic acid-binding protein